MTTGPTTLSSLCLRCGFCCDGTLFARVPVTTDEAQRMRALSLPVVDRADGTCAMEQRCSALGDGLACRVYSDRPSRCREYQCNLYTAVAEGEVDASEALGVIDEGQRLVRELGRSFFGDDDSGEAVVARYRRLATDPNGPELTADVREHFRTLQAFLDRHFRGRAGSGR